jgi:hypothetical protein
LHLAIRRPALFAAINASNNFLILVALPVAFHRTAGLLAKGAPHFLARAMYSYSDALVKHGSSQIPGLLKMA